MARRSNRRRGSKWVSRAGHHRRTAKPGAHKLVQRRERGAIAITGTPETGCGPTGSRRRRWPEASPRLRANGFSQITCLPASMAAIASLGMEMRGKADIHEVDLIIYKKLRPCRTGLPHRVVLARPTALARVVSRSQNAATTKAVGQCAVSGKMLGPDPGAEDRDPNHAVPSAIGLCLQGQLHDLEAMCLGHRRLRPVLHIRDDPREIWQTRVTARRWLRSARHSQRISVSVRSVPPRPRICAARYIPRSRGSSAAHRPSWAARPA